MFIHPDTNKALVKMTTSWGGYKNGEMAGFVPSEARRVVEEWRYGVYVDGTGEPLIAADEGESVDGKTALGSDDTSSVPPPPVPLILNPAGLAEIPSDWETLPGMKKIELAQAISTGKKFRNATEAEETIRVEIARRAQLSA
jgi:hypothetical protein